MARKTKKNKVQISNMLTSLFSFALFVYFAFHLVHGEMGYFAMRGVNSKLSEAGVEYKDVKTHRVSVENRVKRLRPESLDLDMLDERSRAVLGFLDKDEIIIVDK